MDWLRELAVWMRQLWVVWLMLLFVGLTVWVFWPGRKKDLERHGEIPLKDDSPESDEGER